MSVGKIRFRSELYAGKVFGVHEPLLFAAVTREVDWMVMVSGTWIQKKTI